ncbi:calcium-binding protein [Modicisalibacter coralii]|uniref:calcium-binding protein n=1 Tax=Modicisalibacter coralii TaxID=2304602 RepID=UPI00100B559D|nr:calcium-binding protein [Halomonas coralii]
MARLEAAIANQRAGDIGDVFFKNSYEKAVADGRPVSLAETLKHLSGIDENGQPLAQVLATLEGDKSLPLKSASGLAAELEQWHLNLPDALTELSRETRLSLEKSLVGVGGGIVGDVGEFLNNAYESLKHGLDTGDWQPMHNDAVAFGESMVLTAIMVVGTTTLAGVVAGPGAAALVANGWAVYGVADGLINIGELIGKVVDDVGYWADLLSDSFMAWLKDEFGYASEIVSPLVLDLDGDGVETLALENGVYFDHDGNGFAEKSGWVGADDGLLVWDRNGDGDITDGGELFGNHVLLDDDTKAQNGFAALAALDDNDDGIVDAEDANFASLRVWRDANGDGVTQSGELLSLAEAGAAGLEVGYESASFIDDAGNEHLQLGRFKGADGKDAALVDVWFRHDLMDTRDGARPPSEGEAQAGPGLVGYGNVHDLQTAVTLDDSGQLRDLLTRFQSEPDVAARHALIDELMFAWTGADAHAADSRGRYIEDARKLHALEAFMGETFVQGSGTNAGLQDPGPNASKSLTETYQSLADQVYASLAIDAHYADWFADLDIDVAGGEWQVDMTALRGRLARLFDGGEFSDIARILDFGDILSRADTPLTDALLTRLNAEGTPEGADFERLLSSLGQADRFEDSHGNVVKASGAFELLGFSDRADALQGAAGDDELIGLSGGDTLAGGDGDDRLLGGAGHDELFGGAGGDDLLGGEGMDELHGGDGADHLDGQDGDDRLFGDRGRDELLGGVGNDVLHGGDGDDRLAGGNGNDTLVGGLGKDSLAGGEGSDELHGGDGADHLDGQDGDDRLFGDLGRDELLGGAGNDVLHGGDDGDRLYGGDGADTIKGGLGNDILQGSLGDDTLDGGRGNDWIQGGDGSDSIEGGLGDDTLNGGLGDDELEGGRGEDFLLGGGGFNWLQGGLGNDTLRGGDAGNVIAGGDGDDLINGGAGDDVIEGGRGDDTIWQVGGRNTYIFSEGWGNDELLSVTENDVIAFDDTVLPTDIRVGRSDSDLILRSASGDDRIEISLYFSTGTTHGALDRVVFANGEVWDRRAISSKLIATTPGDDIVEGTALDEFINGQAGNDRLLGGGDNDTLVGGAGQDILEGGSGSDEYWFAKGWGQDILNNLAFDHDESTDAIVFRDGLTAEDISVRRDDFSLVIESRQGDDRITVENYFLDDEDKLYRLDTLHFSDGEAWSFEDVKLMMIQGSDGDDHLQGYASDDTLSGGLGNDVIDGGAGNDVLQGGPGDDELVGGTGADIVRYGLGDGHDIIDTVSLYDAERVDVVEFQALLPEDVSVSRDEYDLIVTLDESGETLTINGFLSEAYPSEVETLRFENGVEWTLPDIEPMVSDEEPSGGYDGGMNTEHGTAGDDRLIGGIGMDFLYGEEGNDILEGKGGPDILDGGMGNDRLVGGGGNDSLIDPGGSDIFVVSAGDGQTLIQNTSQNPDNDQDVLMIMDIDYMALRVSYDYIGLMITVEDSDDVIRVAGWQSDETTRLDAIQVGDHRLTKEAIEPLTTDDAPRALGLNEMDELILV